MVPQSWVAAAFIASAVVWETPQEIEFTDQSTGTPTTRWRDFGDGYFSSEQNPTHIYYIAGLYTVSLKVTNRLSEDSEKKVDYIDISETTAWQENVENISEARRGPRSFPPLSDDVVEPDGLAREEWRGEHSTISWEREIPRPPL